MTVGGHTKDDSMVLNIFSGNDDFNNRMISRRP